MPETLDLPQLGTPVPVSQINRELKKLWDTGTGTSAPTRASLINFAVYCRDTDALVENNALLSEFTRNHACRALLICVCRKAPEPHISAWVNAHCHLTRAGKKNVCCEQITFLLEGEIKGRLTNIVFSHLDSDLPLYFWLQDDISERLNPTLWPWIDRLIIDSLAWADPRDQFARLQASLTSAKATLTLRDLNWTRTLYLRQAISAFFDSPAHLAHLPALNSVRLQHAPGHRSTALLLLGWLAGQLGWTLQSPAPLVFQSAQKTPIAIELVETPGAAIGRCTITCGGAIFDLRRETTERYLHADIQLPDGCHYQHLLPAGPETTLQLLDEEMTRGARHAPYLRALAAITPLL
jgi:glucose-6-phosphate dehydrogenase assembly protein OpcA